ncbi:hypothetical protein [Thermobacillus composti]|jgi:hypothetical protein|nr:hypothetical protein [Thermobacillus composti]
MHEDSHFDSGIRIAAVDFFISMRRMRSDEFHCPRRRNAGIMTKNRMNEG